MVDNKPFSKGKIFTDLLWRFGERIAAQFISLIVSIVLARLLGPTEYGAVAIVMIFISIANVFVTNGLGAAIVQKKNPDNLDYSSVFYFNIILSMAIYGVIFLIAPLVATFYSMPILVPGLRVLGLRIIVAAINSIQQAYVSKNMLFKKFFWSTLFGTLLSGIVGILMAYKGFGVWSLIAQYLTNTCTDTIVLWFTVRWRPDKAFSWDRAKKLVSYGWKLLVSALMDTGYNQLRSLIIGKVYSKEDLAFYNQGDKYPSLIVTNINASIGSVIFPVLAENQNDKDKVKKMTRRAIQVSSFAMWPMMVGLGVCAEPLVRLLLTEKWLECVPYLRVFCFTYGLWPIHTANLQAINAMGRSGIFLKLEIIKKSIGIIALLVTLKYGPLAIAWSLIFVGVVSTFINAYPNIKLLGYSYAEQLKDLLPSFIIAVLMGIAIYPIQLINIPDYMVLMLQIIIGIVIYLFLSKYTRQSAYVYCMELIKKNPNNKQKHDVKDNVG